MGIRRQANSSSDARLRRVTLGFVVFLILVMALPACMRLRNETLYLLGHEEDLPLEGAATLVCEAQCRDSSQCGQIDADWVILASSSGPATESHDLTFPDRAAVTIVDQRNVVVQYVSEPTKTQQVRFYQVELPEDGTGWVAGWCIGQPIVP